jgi:hypothetical protein
MHRHKQTVVTNVRFMGMIFSFDFRSRNQIQHEVIPITRQIQSNELFQMLIELEWT